MSLHRANLAARLAEGHDLRASARALRAEARQIRRRAAPVSEAHDSNDPRY
jgi:hypothetical protein